MGLLGTDITGVDVGAGSIKIVRIKGGVRPKIVSAALLELPLVPCKDDDAAEGLGLLRAGRKFGKAIMTLIPGKDLTIRHLTLPKMPLAELREAVRWESKRHISCSLDAAIIEFLILGERHEGTVDKYDVLLVSAERGAVARHVAHFVKAGLSLKAVDANPLALRNMLRFQEEPSDANTLLVDMGAGKTEINVFRKGALRFSRCVESGGFDITRAVAEELAIGFDDAEELKKKTHVAAAPDADRAAAVIRTKLDGILLEIRRSVEYYKTTFREKGIERTILTGGVALTPGIMDYFTRALEGPVAVDKPFDGLDAKKGTVEEFAGMAPRFSAAVGLALRRE